MDKPKKNIASMILAKMKPQESKEDTTDFVDKGTEPEYDAKESAAEDIMSAMEKKDPKMFLEAFKNLMDMCNESSSESEED